MPIEYTVYYDRQTIKANRNKLFVFGDNLARKGYGGQAAEARNEPNSVGIPTKRKPSYDNDAYFKDADLGEWREIAGPDLQRIRDHLADGGIVVWPRDGIGTGLAHLHMCAPLIFRAIREFEESLKVEAEEPPQPKRQIPIEEIKASIQSK